MRRWGAELLRTLPQTMSPRALVCAAAAAVMAPSIAAVSAASSTRALACAAAVIASSAVAAASAVRCTYEFADEGVAYDLCVL